MILQEYYEYGLPQSPNALPSLFYGMHDLALRSPSRLSVNTVFSEDKDKSSVLDQLSSMSPPGSIASRQYLLIFSGDASETDG